MHCKVVTQVGDEAGQPSECDCGRGAPTSIRGEDQGVKEPCSTSSALLLYLRRFSILCFLWQAAAVDLLLEGAYRD